tara:strand:+ start:711 stop:1142 length:432 start_codon:yes stop_codon:yes gene_type:complete
MEWRCKDRFKDKQIKMKKNVKTFKQFERMNEQEDDMFITGGDSSAKQNNKYSFDHPILWIQSLNGEIQWMTVTNYGNMGPLERGLQNVMEDGMCDTCTVLDIKGGINGKSQCDIFAGEASPSGKKDLYVEGCNVIHTYSDSDF